jgi:D-alanyl-D-alanine carboxypeptidase
MIVSRVAGDKLMTECKVKKNIEAPIKAGDVVGEVNYYSNKELLKTCKITAKNSIEKMSFNSVISAVWKSVVNM